MLWLVDRFGWDAAHNAPAGELRRMLVTERIYRAYHERQKSENWAVWAQKNKDQSRLLNAAMLAAEELEDG